MHELRLEQVYCPYCGQPFEAIIDTSNQDYIEDFLLFNFRPNFYNLGIKEKA